MIITLNDISGGIRETAPRLFPPNAVEVAKNVIPNVSDSVFVVSPAVGEILTTPNNNDYLHIYGKILGTTTGSVIYFIRRDWSGANYTYYLYKYDGSLSLVGSLYTVSSLDTIQCMFVSAIGDILIHTGNATETRFTHKTWKYSRFGTDYELTAVRGLPDDSSDVATPTATLFNITETDYMGATLDLTDTKIYTIKTGIRFDGYQSIIFGGRPKEYFNGDTAASGDNAMIVRLNVSDSIVHRITGIDLYCAVSDEPRPSIDNYNYVDTVPFDHEETFLTLTNCTIASGVITSAVLTSLSLVTNQWEGFCATIGGNDYYINSNAASSITIDSVLADGANKTVVIKSKWVQKSTSTRWYMGYFLTSVEGENYIYRTGVPYDKTLDSADYCPPAKFIETFKGFTWLGYYYGWEDRWYKNRLIKSIVNTDGIVCHDIYNQAEYIEFESEITAVKGMRDYMLVATMDGIYTVRFVPSQDIGGYTWAVKKISNVVVKDNKQVSGIGDECILFNNRVIYRCDGFSVSPVISLEQQEILNDYMSTAGKQGNYYSVHYDEYNGNILLALNDIIRLVKGLFVLDLDATYNGMFIGNYDKDPVLLTNNSLLLVQDIESGSVSPTFNVTFFETDLGIKEDKYFVTAVVRAEKGNSGDVIVNVYLDGTLVQTLTYRDGTSYSGYKDIFLPKSKKRRFETIKFKIENGASTSPDFKLKSIDVEIEPIRRTNVNGQ